MLLPQKLEQVLKLLEVQDGPPVPKAGEQFAVLGGDWCCEYLPRSLQFYDVMSHGHISSGEQHGWFHWQNPSCCQDSGEMWLTDHNWYMYHCVSIEM